MFTTLPVQTALVARAGTLEVRLATTLAEVDAAMRLRYEVFNLELLEGLQASYDRGFDADAYDGYCDHLIVEDIEARKIVGTYRLLRRAVAERNIGFYSENEFDLSKLKRHAGEMVELGRSCIARSHRSFATINLLWSAISAYAAAHRARYLFGCGSLHVASVEEVQPIYAYLRAHHLADDAFRVEPVASCRMALSEEEPEPDDARRVARMLSPIMKGYLRAGAVVCGAPAYDAEFGTADVLVLMETDKMAARYKHHYGAEH